MHSVVQGLGLWHATNLLETGFLGTLSQHQYRKYQERGGHLLVRPEAVFMTWRGSMKKRTRLPL